MKEPTLRQLRFLLAVADHGSVQAAAKALHMSPTGVSVGLDELDHIIGVQLTVRRRSKGAALTPAGREVVRRARAIQDAVAELGVAAQQIRGTLTGVVRVGCFPTQSPALVPELLERLQHTHPGLEVDLVEDSADRLQDQVRAGELDLALMLENQADRDLEVMPIMPTHTQVQISPRHRLGMRRRLRLAELAEEPLVLLNVEPNAKLTLASFTDRGLTPKVLTRTASHETIRSLVGRRLGYTLIMGVIQRRTSIEGLPLAYIPLADDLPANAVVAVRRPGGPTSARVTAAMRVVRAIGLAAGNGRPSPASDLLPG
ncbi:LysR family transcriptional regulator [Enemella evansiae]|uniref:LysR family transcriptional regulator n=1 Tax=Enemella evansiae TaxID=2016499 RepID=UPI000B96A9CD|nr:LysR substrate-binding domain-containing protein [Enemella evansiae]PFG66523.1 DNA-binding transcriptional LysR family regulator [Propionibacteriaceae bacterium ES.041]OYN93357.1 hypothetical protein CGZ95_18495 [Enemella evansiae]OYN98012.1 hypothetical protein CGZ96_09850 [Enemella evansiae]OYO05961.1 hypothetical protein CGZ97_04635 [Enemella evansiae]OYO07303.1 hypothetical protein CGZ98_20670 [Enemella evansiae]